MVKLKSDVKSAMIYPIAVIVISIIVISIIMIVVIPAFKNIFEGLLGPGEKLPWLTEIVVSISQIPGRILVADSARGRHCGLLLRKPGTRRTKGITSLTS